MQRPHLACMQARAGRNYTSSSLLATSADTVESAVSTRLYDVGRLSVQPRAQRAPHGEVPIPSALKCIRALAWSRLWDEAVRNTCAEVVDSSAALRSGSPQTSGRWSIPVGRAPDVVSGKSSHSLALARSAGRRVNPKTPESPLYVGTTMREQDPRQAKPGGRKQTCG